MLVRPKIGAQNSFWVPSSVEGHAYTCVTTIAPEGDISRNFELEAKAGFKPSTLIQDMSITRVLNKVANAHPSNLLISYYISYNFNRIWEHVVSLMNII